MVLKINFDVTLKYVSHGDDYGNTDLTLCCGKNVVEEMLKVKKYIIDTCHGKKANEKYKYE